MILQMIIYSARTMLDLYIAYESNNVQVLHLILTLNLSAWWIQSVPFVQVQLVFLTVKLPSL